ncbi:hypothetical protein LS70_009215 [Helicobacter sp. MIT 11-5569]|uniref:hypothetical protein n=1 Tax=Helicobacter sp. MIT 11-5569 TaxID=1548151 RepID=UPI00051FC638|nr:hypothetical protein [Helicobacter sp. MIT 11-5569]TLD80350.1 hypothetical protein LS70_009215 [Helicobacter sp. MIT 11-5569]
MKKAILAVILIGVNSVFGEMLGELSYKNEDGSNWHSRAFENQQFTFDLKVDALKKLGFRYCIKNFVDDKNSQVYYLIKDKLDMPLFFDDKNKDNIMNFLDYVHNRMSWTSSKTINYIYIPFKCLEIYEDKDYHKEVERIVKKYCKDCK